MIPRLNKETSLFKGGAISEGIADAKKVATNFITEITGGGIMVHPENDSTSGWKISDALELLKSGVSYIKAWLDTSVTPSVAKVRVGIESSSNIVLSGSGYIDLRKGDTTVLHIGTASDSQYNQNQYFTYGTRDDWNIGDYSATFGKENSAQGDCSMAVGYNCRSEWGGSFTSGSHCVAGVLCHAEGEYTEAGDVGTLDQPRAAHAEGYHTSAWKTATHAEGCYTCAWSDYQHVQGKYNIGDSSNVYAHIVGNGTADNARSNAHTLDWSGNAWFAGTVTQASDRRLKDHKSYLSQDAIDFIRELKPALFDKDGSTHTGFYAQDVRESDPWDSALVAEDAGGYLALDYSGLIAPLVAYCQHLEARIEELERKEA